jgi:hypothetical protein
MTLPVRATSILALAAWLGLASAGPVGPATAATAPQAKLRQTDALARMADDVAHQVERLRGWTFKRPVRKERVSLTGAHDDLQRILLASDKPDHRAKLQAFLRVAGLIPPDCDLFGTSLAVLDDQVAGYYEPETRTLRLVDRPTAQPEFVERMILSHELTHALDDQYVDLRSMLKAGGESEDADFVVTAVSEGSATSLMLQEMVADQKSGRFSFADLSQYVAAELDRARALEQLPRYFSAMFGSYVVGAAFLAHGDLATVMTQPDNRAVGEALLTARRAMPRSSEQILHPEKYWDSARRDEPVVFDDKAMTLWVSRPGRHIVLRDTLGELLTAILTEPRDAKRNLMEMQSASAWTNAGAMGWGGDRFYLLADRSGFDVLKTTKGLHGVWVTTWDTPKDRDKFLLALDNGNPPPNSVAVPVGSQSAIVFIAMAESERASLVRRFGLLARTMTRGGRSWMP